MNLDLENLTQPELKSQLEKYMRLFDVVHGTLLRLSLVRLDAEAMRTQMAADAIKIIEYYPNHPAFTAQPTEARS